MDPILELERRRLLISATLTAQARRRLGDSLAANVSATELLGLANGLREVADAVEGSFRLRFEPAYPGVTAGAQRVGGSYRLVLACGVCDRDGTPLGVV